MARPDQSFTKRDMDAMLSDGSWREDDKVLTPEVSTPEVSSGGSGTPQARIIFRRTDFRQTELLAVTREVRRVARESENAIPPSFDANHAWRAWIENGEDSLGQNTDTDELPYGYDAEGLRDECHPEGLRDEYERKYMEWLEENLDQTQPNAEDVSGIKAESDDIDEEHEYGSWTEGDNENGIVDTEGLWEDYQDSFARVRPGSGRPRRTNGRYHND